MKHGPPTHCDIHVLNNHFLQKKQNKLKLSLHPWQVHCGVDWDHFEVR